MMLARLFLLAHVVLLYFGASAQELRFPANQFSNAYLQLPQNSASSKLESLLKEKADNFELVGGFTDKYFIKKLSHSVGRLDLLVRERAGVEWIEVCTATLVSANHILTARHCLQDSLGRDLNIVDARIRFDFYGGSGGEGQDYKVNFPPVESPGNYDFAILKVDGEPGSSRNVVRLASRIPGPGEELVIIHHPAAKPMRVTRRFCRASQTSHANGAELRHRCDTLGGSSGAPIFVDDGTNELVAIHIQGGLDETPESFNLAQLVAVFSADSPLLQEQLSDQSSITIEETPEPEAEPPSELDGIDVHYFEKEADHGLIAQILSDAKVSFQARIPESDTESNVITCTDDVSGPAIVRLATLLLENGVRIRAITRSIHRVSNRLTIETYGRHTDKDILTLDDIAGITECPDSGLAIARYSKDLSITNECDSATGLTVYLRIWNSRKAQWEITSETGLKKGVSRIVTDRAGDQIEYDGGEYFYFARGKSPQGQLLLWGGTTQKYRFPLPDTPRTLAYFRNKRGALHLTCAS